MAIMARDSIKIPVVIKALICGTFFDPRHSQNNDIPFPGTATELFFLVLIIITVDQASDYWPFVQ
jgi:hypothetical protein